MTRTNLGFRPPVKLSPRARKARQALHDRYGAVHSSAGIDRRAFEELEREGLAVVTHLGRLEWVAEHGARDRTPVSVSIPAPVAPPVPGDDLPEQIAFRIRGAALLEAARIHRQRGHSYMETTDGGQTVGWVYGVYNREFGWVTADAQTEQPRYSSQDEAAEALRQARRRELNETQSARHAVAHVHPAAHLFRPVQDAGGRVAGWTYHTSTEALGQASWVTAADAVSRRMYSDPGVAAAALLKHLDGPAEHWQDDQARTRVRSAHRRAFDLVPVLGENPDRTLLGWTFSVVPTHLGYGDGFTYGWVTAAGVVADELTASRESACQDLAASWVLDQPYVPPAAA
ncbi:hypothetical protein [Streptomyces sp. NPDC059564]|uniref:hypothetical protein n=1 Tax=Streptomyces sp. NPDC059564 TaxID=3346865 RepID=UPI0036CDA832